MTDWNRITEEDIRNLARGLSKARHPVNIRAYSSMLRLARKQLERKADHAG